MITQTRPNELAAASDSVATILLSVNMLKAEIADYRQKIESLERENAALRSGCECHEFSAVAPMINIARRRFLSGEKRQPCV
jgi:cell division protein FtsB